jgi:hypothetical protein
MLTIKDLASTKQLGASEMSAVRGGHNVNFGNSNVAAGGGFGSPSSVFAPVTQVDASSTTANTVLQNFGGFQMVGGFK